MYFYHICIFIDNFYVCKCIFIKRRPNALHKYTGTDYSSLPKRCVSSTNISYARTLRIHILISTYWWSNALWSVVNLYLYLWPRADTQVYHITFINIFLELKHTYAIYIPYALFINLCRISVPSISGRIVC